MAARLRRAHLGVVDRRADRDRPDAARPGRDPADPLDAEPADPRARDEGDPAALQVGPSEAVGRADEVLQGEQDQPVRVLSPDRLPDPDLHLALLRPQGLREGDLPEVPGLVARLARPRRHHRAREGRLGAGAHRRLRREPADLDVPHVDSMQRKAQRYMVMVLPIVFLPVHPRLPVGAHDLLAHDEPLDDGAGHRHATPDAEAASFRRNARAGRRRRRSRRLPATASPRRRAEAPKATSGGGAPRRVKRKRGGRTRK